MRKTSRAVPIWSCSRWGLPCRLCCQRRGALLPHHFNLAAANLPRRAGRRCHFCGAIPGVAPAGRYPAPSFRGARTFLEQLALPAVTRPSDGRLIRREFRPARNQHNQDMGIAKIDQARQHFTVSYRHPACGAEMALEGGDDLFQRRVGIIAVARQRSGTAASPGSLAVRPEADAGFGQSAPTETIRRDRPCAPAPHRCGPARARAEWDGAPECRGTA